LIILIPDVARKIEVEELAGGLVVQANLVKIVKINVAQS